MKIYMIVLFFSGFLGISFIPEKLIDKNEICNFDVVDNYFVYSYSDGTVCILDFNTGKIKSSFMLKNYDFEYSFNISKTSKHILAVYSGELWKGDDLYGTVTFYDLLEGKKIRTIRLENGLALEGLGFSADGKYFYCLATLNWHIYCIDVKSGKIIWRSDIEDYLSNGSMYIRAEDIYIRADGISYVGFNDSNAVAVFDKDGKELWSNTMNGYIAFPAQQPKEPSDVLMLIIRDEKKQDRIAEMSLKDGSIIWKRGVEYDSIRATTQDKKTQAIYINGHMCISHFPDNKIIEIPEIMENCDAVFTQDGTKLFCLPKLETTIVDKEHFGPAFQFKRNSNILRIVDCNTGKIVKEFELKRPVIK